MCAPGEGNGEQSETALETAIFHRDGHLEERGR